MSITFSPIVVFFDDLIDQFGVSESSLQGFFDHIWVVPFVSSEPVNV